MFFPCKQIIDDTNVFQHETDSYWPKYALNNWSCTRFNLLATRFRRKHIFSFINKFLAHFPGNTTLTYEIELFDIRAPPQHTDTFSHIDSDGDKQLTRKEVSAYMKSQAEAYHAPVHDKRWKKQHKKHVDSIFDHEDTDEDGFISHDEFSGPKMEYHDEF